MWAEDLSMLESLTSHIYWGSEEEDQTQEHRPPGFKENMHADWKTPQISLFLQTRMFKAVGHMWQIVE